MVVLGSFHKLIISGEFYLRRSFILLLEEVLGLHWIALHLGTVFVLCVRFIVALTFVKTS